MTVWIHRDTAAQMIEAARTLHPLETGGVLLGWRDGGERIVVDVIGPGPYALHGRHMFVPDHPWQLRQIRAAFAGSQGDLDYLGDWHSHPAGVAEMSAQDERTLTRLTRRVSQALMVIAAGADDTWSFGAWSQPRRSLFGRGVTEAREIKYFTAPADWPRFTATD
jgi:integrative and conjugative element protein (TIGR02256 family)